MVFKNSTYDKLKWIAQILIPLLGSCYYGLGKIWGFPYIEEIVGTFTVIDTFLGGLLGISTINYKERKEKELQEAMDLNDQNI